MNENAILPGFYGRFLLVYAMATPGRDRTLLMKFEQADRL